MEINSLLIKIYEQVAIILTAIVLSIPNTTYASGGAGDGGGTGCRYFVMQAAASVAQIITDHADIFNPDLTGSDFLKNINSNDIVSVPTNKDKYVIEYKKGKFHVQCQALEAEGTEMIESLITAEVFKKINEETHNDYLNLFEIMGLHSIPKYLNPEKNAADIAIQHGFRQKTNHCSLHISLGQGAHGDLDIDLQEFENQNRKRITTAYYVINEAANIKDDYIDFVTSSINNVFKSKNVISEKMWDYDIKATHKFKIRKLKINKRTHTYLVDQDITLECEKPLN